MKKIKFFTLLIIAITMLISGCAQKETIENFDSNDELYLFEEVPQKPTQKNSGFLYHYNKTIFKFNHTLYEYVLNPLSDGYEAVVPDIAKRGLGNFFENLRTIERVLSGSLQGDLDYALNETWECLGNSTAGILGFRKAINKNPGDNRTISQAIGSWKIIPEGPIIVVPILGPKSLLDLTGSITGGYLSPQSWTFNGEFFMPLTVEENLNGWREKYGPYEKVFDASLDEFTGIMRAYEEKRAAEISK
jgi:phospholipid-binding lipoprotein MlaA